MKRTVAVAVALAVVALALFAASFYWSRGPLLTLSPEELLPNRPSVRPYSGLQQSPLHIKWIWDGGGRSGRKGALNVSFSRYKAEDGATVERIVETYESTAKAQQRLNSLTAHSSKVIESVTQRLSQDRKDRVHVVANERGQRVTIIAWTNRSAVYMLRSLSPLHVMDFEEQVYGPES